MPPSADELHSSRRAALVSAGEKKGPGGPGRLPAQGSHRPERAQLTHSVPQVTPSLRQRRTVAANPLRAIRWPCVDTQWEVDASRVFPSNGVVTRRPASLPRVQGGASSPASTVLSGRYDFLPLLPPRFVAFAWRYHSSARVSPARGRALPRAVFWSWSPGISGREFVSGNGRISYVPGEPPLCSCPALRPR